MRPAAWGRKSPPKSSTAGLTTSTPRFAASTACTPRPRTARRSKPPSCPAWSPLLRPSETFWQSDFSSMAITITIPRLGWNMDEGVFHGWLKHDGDPVRAGESLFTLESEKATEDVECLDSGILRIPPGSPKDGDPVRVGDVIGYLVEPGETPPFEKEQRQVKEAVIQASESPASQLTSKLADHQVRFKGRDPAISPR